MGLISSDLVQQQLAALRGEGVTIRGRPEKFAPKAGLGWLLGKHAECSLADLVGERAGYGEVVMDADRAGDVDVLVKADRAYCIQVKSLNFFESKQFGEQMSDDLRRISESVVQETPQNIAYRGGFGEQKQLTSWEIPTETANVGYIQYQPSYFGQQQIRRKLYSQLQKAAQQLRPGDSMDRRNLAAIDVRYFHAVGDQTYHDIVFDLFKTNESLAVIDYGLLISFELAPDSGARQPATRLVPIPNPRTDRDINVDLFSDPPIQLYKVRPFTLPIKIQMEQGWNNLLRIEKGQLHVEDTPIMSLL
jgi:hypothetical protein